MRRKLAICTHHLLLILINAFCHKKAIISEKNLWKFLQLIFTQDLFFFLVYYSFIGHILQILSLLFCSINIFLSCWQSWHDGHKGTLPSMPPKKDKTNFWHHSSLKRKKSLNCFSLLVCWHFSSPYFSTLKEARKVPS